MRVAPHRAASGQDQGVARVVLVEPYYGGSHRAWADGLVAHSRHEIHLVTHDAAYWRWRLRGSALTLAEDVEAVIDRHGPPDLLLATDMVHLAALVGFLRRVLGDAAVALYLHENQLTHPVGPRDRPDEGLALANWLSMAVADRVLVNSEAQLADLRSALPVLLGRALDHGHAHRLDGGARPLRGPPRGRRARRDRSRTGTRPRRRR